MPRLGRSQPFAPIIRRKIQYAIPPASQLALTGPTSGVVNVASSAFTVTPDGTYTGTVTPATGGTGTFSPTSLTWSGDNSAKTFTYTPTTTAGSPHSISIGASPTITITGSPIAYTVTQATTTYDLTSASYYGVGFQVEGHAVLAVNLGLNCWNSGRPTAVRFKTVASGAGSTGTLEAYVYCSGLPMRLTIDGTDQASVTLPNTSAWQWVTIGSSLDTNSTHEYALKFGQIATGENIQQVRLTGFTANTNFLPARPTIIGFGDSIVAGDNYGTPVDLTLSFLHKACVSLSYQEYNLGAHSSAVVGDGDTTSRINAVTQLLPPGTVVVVLYGTNDVAAGTPQATFGAAYQDMIQRLQAGLPGVLVLNERLLKTSVGDTSRDAFSGEISTRVSAVGAAKVVYAQGMYGAYSGADGIHPGSSASTGIAAALVTDIQAALGTGGGNTYIFNSEC